MLLVTQLDGGISSCLKEVLITACTLTCCNCCHVNLVLSSKMPCFESTSVNCKPESTFSITKIAR